MSFLVVANWKMGGNGALMRDMLHALCADDSCLSRLKNKRCDVILCPPFTALEAFTQGISNVHLGAQNCFSSVKKGCTGEISPAMLHECGCEYVVLGHSDRRVLLDEADDTIRLKAELAMEKGLIPIICVGESLSERESGISRDILLGQCERCLPKKGDFFVAYEPVWAIGRAVIPGIEIIGESIDIIRSHSQGLRVMYGGSVNGSNICSLKAGIKDLQGVLVGSASMQIETFLCMVKNVLECL